MTVYNFSLSNHDMLSGDVRDAMRLSANQAAMHADVYPSLFSYPNYDLSNVASYIPFNSNDWLLNPSLAVSSANMSMNTGIFNSPFNTWSCSSSSSSSTNEEDILAEDKYNRLKQLVDSIIKEGILDKTDEAKLKAARNKSGTAKEKYNAIQKAFDEIDQSTVKNYILTKGENIKINGTTLPDYRRSIGLGEGAKSVSADNIRALTTAIDLVSGSNPDSMSGTGLFNDLSVGTVDILDLLSRYNSIESENLMTKMMSKAEYTVVQRNIDIMVTKLIEKAQSTELRKYLSADSIENLDSAIESLKNCSKYDQTKTAAFNELYRLTRLAAAIDLDYRLQKDYGDLSSQIFGSQLFSNKTIQDLNNEGFDVYSNEITIDASSAQKVTNSNNNSSGTANDASGQLTDLVRKGALVQTNVMYTIKDENGEPLLDVNGKEVKVRLYKEKFNTDDRDYQRVFYTYKGKVYELLNKNIDNVNEATNDDQLEIDASTIRASERTDFSDIKIGLTNSNFGLASVPGYFNNETKDCKGYGAYDVAGKVLVNDMKAQVEVTIKKQLKEQGYDTNSVEFSNLFEAAYADAKSYACDKCVKVKEGKSSWNAFWSGDGLSGWKTSSKVNIKDLVDTFIKKFNSNINNSIKNKPLASWEETPKKEESGWKKIQKVAPWVSALGCGAGFLIGGPVGLGIGIASTVIAAGSALTSCCKTVGKWLGL